MSRVYFIFQGNSTFSRYFLDDNTVTGENNVQFQTPFNLMVLAGKALFECVFSFYTAFSNAFILI